MRRVTAIGSHMPPGWIGVWKANMFLFYLEERPLVWNKVGLCHYAAKAKDEDRHLASPLPSGGTAEKGKLVLATWKILLSAKSAFLKFLQHPEELLF